MAQKVFNIIIKLLKEGGADKETVSGLVDIKNALVTGAAIAGTFAVAYKTVDKVLDETVGKFAAYATEVDVFKSALSTTAEEGSRLIQVADDFGISAEEMQKSMFRAVKEGFEPTIEGLAGMADEYNALATPQEKADFLVKNFGKSSQELTRLLGEGGQAIRDRAAAVSDSLVMDEAAIQKAREYAFAQDALNDSIDGFKISIGERFIPPITAAINSMADAATANELYTRAMELGIDVGRNMGTGLIAVNGELVTQAELLQLVTEAENKNKDVIFISGPLYAAWLLSLKDVNTEIEKQTALLKDETGWEVMYTAAQTATEQTKISFDWLGEQLTTQMGDMSLQGGELWQALLMATGEISPAALAAFLQVQADFLKMKEMLEAGIAVPIVAAWYWAQGQTGVAPSREEALAAAGGTPLTPSAGGTSQAAINQAWLNYWNQGGTRPTGEYLPKLAFGGLFSSFMASVGEQGEEWLVRNAAGSVVVLPNDMVRQMKGWGISPNDGFSDGGRISVSDRISVGDYGRWEPRSGGKPFQGGLEPHSGGKPFQGGLEPHSGGKPPQGWAAEFYALQRIFDWWGEGTMQYNGVQISLLRSILNAIEGLSGGFEDLTGQFAAEIQKRM
jgi:hypothetical protein